jgi:AbrB family looped-hinge helix DNA binding protein
MQTSVTKRGQTVIPAAIRHRYHIRAGDKLVWLDDGEIIQVIPVSKDAIQALYGRGKDESLVAALLEERQKDRLRE